MTTNQLSAVGLLLSAPAIVLWGSLLAGSERGTRLHDLVAVPSGVAVALETLILIVLPLAGAVVGRVATRRAEGPNPTALERMAFGLGLALVVLGILGLLVRRG
jgi:hypothetical protein